MKEKVKKFAIGGGVGSVVAALSALPVFAEGVTPYVISSSDLSPITTTINSAVTNAVPIGLGIMATMIGIGIVAKIIYRFA